MKVSLNWLKDFIDVDLTSDQAARILTETGLEVEAVEKVESVKGGLEGIVVGEVLTKDKHPDADRLSVTTVNVGQHEALQIVCGAPNVAAGQKVLVALSGSTIYPTDHDPIKIKRSKIRGVESNGMICAEDELGLGTSHDGILVLDASSTVGMSGREYFDIEDDYLLEIGLTPNRTDAMGHYGVARDLIAYLQTHEDKGSLTKLSVYEEIHSEDQLKITIEDSDLCPRYAGAVIRGLEVKESPNWLKNRLLTIGLKPINNLVDVTNYVMHETGNPLHAFDLTKVGSEIIVRRAQKGEKLITLDEIERKLDTNDLMICNASDPMCIGGVFGGLDSGVSENTKEIFLEAAWFNPVSIRKSAKRHQLSTDSSFRFERGVDPANVDYAMRRAIQLILEVAGGEVTGLYDIYPKKAEPHQVELSVKRLNTLTGLSLDAQRIQDILTSLEIKVLEMKEDLMMLEIPTYRVEVTREADIIEEVLRIYGYNRVELPTKLNASLSYRQKPDREKLYNTAADLLVSNGFYELLNNSLTSGSSMERVINSGLNPGENVTILNPLSQELDVMRQHMIFGGLRNIEYNQNRQHPDLKLFEFGKTYKKTLKYEESNRLAIWMTGSAQEENWTNKSGDISFFHLKGILESLLQRFGLDDQLKTDVCGENLLEDGYSLTLNQKVLANAGWVRKEIQKVFGIRNRVYYADIDWDYFVQLASNQETTFKPLPKTQFVRRDFSLLLDEHVKFEQIRSLAFNIDKKLLKEIGLFDVYEGKNLDAGKKSYAVSFIFQDDEKTLKDKQVDAIMERLKNSLVEEIGAQLR